VQDFANMTRSLVATVLLTAFVAVCQALYTGEYLSERWIPDGNAVDLDFKVKFVVALNLRNVAHMHKTLLDVSNPQSKTYGKYFSREQISEKYGPSKEGRQQVVDFFKSLPGAEVHAGEHSDMFEVSAPVSSIHRTLGTELSWVKHAHKQTEKRSLRAMKPINIPQELHEHISFVSLNVPVNHVMPRAAKALSTLRREARKAAGVEYKDDHFDSALADAAAGSVGVSTGNQEALAFFKPYCGIGAASTNQENPPCASSDAVDMPTFTVSVSEHANIQGNTYLTSQEPVVYTVPASTVYCYNTYTTAGCSGADGNNCTCIAKVTQCPPSTSVLPITCAFGLGLYRSPTCPSTRSCALTSPPPTRIARRSRLWALPACSRSLTWPPLTSCPTCTGCHRACP
jgi:hypothetical protein